MYVPRHFAMNDRDAIRMIGDYPFATLITRRAAETLVSHAPLLLSEDGQALEGHLAAANPHAGALATGETTAVFQGPHGYISPGWYQAPNQVPTWNYQAVHISGPVTPIEQPDDLLALVTRLSDHFEAGRAQPWQMAKLDAKTRDLLLSHITGFRINITTLSAKAKLSQNKPAELAGVLQGLATEPPADLNLALRQAMQQHQD